MEKKPWFKNKTSHWWSWNPCSWQGWLTMFIWAVLFLTAVAMMDHEWLKNVALMVLSTFFLFYICNKKGEKSK